MTTAPANPTTIAELAGALHAARHDPDRTAELVELWTRSDPDTLTAATAFARRHPEGALP